MKSVLCRWTAASLFLLASGMAMAAFPATEVFLPAVGRAAGNGAQIFTTVWATNLTEVQESFTFHFLKQGQSNAAASSPITRWQIVSDAALASTSFTDTLAPGETKIYENVVETKLGLTGVIGAARIVSSGEIFIAERIFNQNPGDDVGKTEGMFFTGVPKNFSIHLGQSASVQAVDQGGAENFRTNFVLVETGGGSPTVNVQVFDGGGVLQGQKAYPLLPFEQILPNITDVVPGISTINSRITATVTGGTGSVILALAQIANESQDPSGAEMSFQSSLLGGGGAAAGVTSLNSLTGALTITPGNGISITPSGSSIEVAFTGGGSSGITSVTHDASLTGAGTGASPLAIASGQVVRSLNGLHDTVTLAAGANIEITPSGNTLTFATGGGLSAVTSDSTLTGFGTDSQPLGVAVPLVLQTSAANIGAVRGTGTDIGVQGLTSSGSSGVYGQNELSSGLIVGQRGGVVGDSATHDGVVGLSNSGRGVFGHSTQNDGVRGASGSSVGVSGHSDSSTGVRGSVDVSTSNDTEGVLGVDGTGGVSIINVASAGIRGESSAHVGVVGLSGGSNGVLGITNTGTHAVEGKNNSAPADGAGVFGVDGTGTANQSGAASAGVRGESKTRVGVQGLTDSGIAGVRGLTNGGGASGTSAGVIGVVLASGVRGELGSRRSGMDFALFTSGNVSVTGNQTVSGTKSFVEPHPTDPTKEIRFVCLEGPESGTYFRGSGHIVGGFARIPVPEYFRLVSDDEGLTVVATVVGGPGAIWVVKKNLNEIVLQANSDVEFDYMVNGVRKAYKDFEVVRENQLFIPDGPDDQRFAQYALAIQRRLVANGIYNADGTVNIETARRLGWDKNWRARTHE